MKFTILLIAIFVSNEIDNRGYPTTATVLLLVAAWEAFLGDWARGLAAWWRKVWAGEG